MTIFIAHPSRQTRKKEMSSTSITEENLNDEEVARIALEKELDKISSEIANLSLDVKSKPLRNTLQTRASDIQHRILAMTGQDERDPPLGPNGEHPEDTDSGRVDHETVENEELVDDETSIAMAQLAKEIDAFSYEHPSKNANGWADEVDRQLGLLRNYFADNSNTAVITNSFNRAIPEMVEITQDTVISTGTPETAGYEEVRFTNVKIVPPFKDGPGAREPLLPYECRRLRKSYEFKIVAVRKWSRWNGTKMVDVPIQDVAEIEIGRVPLMLGSTHCFLNPIDVPRSKRIEYHECPVDPFGYFIVDGKMRALVGQEKLSTNQPILIDKGAKKGTALQAEIQILCQLPSKVLSKHTIFEYPVALSDRAEVMININGFTDTNSLNVISLLRLLKIAEQFSVPKEERLPSGPIVTERLDELVVEMSRGATDITSTRDIFEDFIVTTRGLALHGSDDEFLASTTSLFQLPTELEPLYARLLDILFPQISVDAFVEVLKVTKPKLDPDSDEFASLVFELQQNAKEYLLVHMVYRLFLYRRISKNEVDDRDSFGLKRVELVGALMVALFAKAMQAAVKSIRYSLQEKPNAKVPAKAKTPPALPEQVKRYFSSSTGKKDTQNNNNITNVFHSSFTTEYWGLAKNYTTTKSVSHVIETDTISAIIASVRRLTSKGDQAKRNVAPHLNHPSSSSVSCCLESPDDTKTGIIKYLAISTDVSRNIPTPTTIRAFLLVMKKNKYKVLAYDNLPEEEDPTKPYYPCFINGTPIGYAVPKQVMMAVEGWRRNAPEADEGVRTLGVYIRRRRISGLYQEEIHVLSTPDRLIRPLLTTVPVDEEDPEGPRILKIDAESKRLQLNLWEATWRDLVYKYKVIDYIDKQEEGTYSQTLAWFPYELYNSKGIRYQYCEVNPILVLGYNAGSIPFGEFVQTTRLAYAANMIKHAVGVPSQAYRARLDTSMKILTHPQKPLVSSEVYKAAGLHESPTGFNPIVAIITGSYNIEDAIIVNRDSVALGMGHSTTFVTVNVLKAAGEFDIPLTFENRKAVQQKRERADFGTKVHRVNPDQTPYAEVKTGSYQHLAQEIPENQQQLPRGIVRPGTNIQKGDILITKVRPKDKSVVEYRQAFKHTRAGRVEDVQLVDSRGSRGVEMKLALPNVPQEGDKMASIHSQKGLIAQLRPAADMYFNTDTGERPDILFNPHGLPGRQTFGQIMEMFFGKAIITAPISTTSQSYPSNQRYNALYTLDQVEECYLRPYMVANMWMTTAETQLIGELRKEYAKRHPKRYSIALDEPIVDLGSNAALQVDLKEIGYSDNALYNILIKQPNPALRRGQLPEFLKDIDQDAITKHSKRLRQVLLALAPKIIKPNQPTYLITHTTDANAINNISLDRLRRMTDLDGPATVDAYSRIDEVKRTIQELALKYKQSAKYVKEVSTEGREAVRVPLSLLRSKARKVYDLLTTRYSSNYIPLVDVVSLKNKSSTANERLTSLRLHRANVENVVKKASNATTFNTAITPAEISTFLTSIGWGSAGEQTFINGENGEEVVCSVFSGPSYYHMMTQMAADKISYRGDTGKIQATTRQPVEGRQNEGGGKMEEMATISALSHGAPHFLHEKLDQASAKTEVLQCRACSKLCIAGRVDDAACAACGSTSLPVRLPLPWNTLRLNYYLMAMGMGMNFGGDVVGGDTRAFIEQEEDEADQNVEDYFESTNLLNIG
jgi:DNA-directed RNA polymerase beta subunit